MTTIAAPPVRIAREEIFGPVVCVIPFDSVDEAVDRANDSDHVDPPRLGSTILGPGG